MLAARNRSLNFWTWLLRGALAVLWLLVLGLIYWWLPYPARATLGRSGQMILVAFSADGQTLVTMRRLQREKPKQDPTDDDIVKALSQFMFPLYAGPIQIWDTRTGKERTRLVANWKHIRRVIVSPAGHYVAGANDEGGVKLWDLQTGKELATLAALWGANGEDDFWFSPDGKTLASQFHVEGPSLGRIQLIDTATGKQRAVI